MKQKLSQYCNAPMVKKLQCENCGSEDLIEIVDDGKLKTSEILSECRKNFNIYSWCSNEQLDKDFPPVKTKRKFKYTQEPDIENANKSANDLNRSEQITLRERLLMELLYWKKEGKHLDIDNITLCTGSRYSGGDVPSVYWLSGNRKVCVAWYSPDYCYVCLRSRSAV